MIFLNNIIDKSFFPVAFQFPFVGLVPKALGNLLADVLRYPLCLLFYMVYKANLHSISLSDIHRNCYIRIISKKV